MRLIRVTNIATFYTFSTFNTFPTQMLCLRVSDFMQACSSLRILT